MEETLTYVDSEIFVAAAVDNGEKGKTAVDFVFQQSPLATSAFTFSEIIRTITKVSGKSQAVWASEKLSNVSHIAILPIDAQIIKKSIELYKTTNLNIRQTIHLATMQVNNITQIASLDPAFDKVKGIKRVKI